MWEEREGEAAESAKQTPPRWAGCAEHWLSMGGLVLQLAVGIRLFR